MRRVGLERDLPDYSASPQALEVEITRRTLGRVFLQGHGIEVGAGTRPWKLPADATCFYGDILDEAGLERYFGTTGSPYQGCIDAQTYAGLADENFDFALSAHVLEHLINPIESIKQALRVVKPNGIVMFAIPDKRYTWDDPRPITPLQHLVSDFRTGGEDTRIDGCREHVVYLHPQWAEPIAEADIEAEAARLAAAKFDTHYHTWTTETFIEMMEWISGNLNTDLIHIEVCLNENIGVLRKR